MFKINVRSEMHAVSHCCRFAALQSCGYSVSLPLSLHPNRSATVALHPILVKMC